MQLSLPVQRIVPLSFPPRHRCAGASSLPSPLGSHSSLSSSPGEMLQQPCEGQPVSARCHAPGTAADPCPGHAEVARHGIYTVLLLVSPQFIPAPEQPLPEPVPALTLRVSRRLLSWSPRAILLLLPHRAGTWGGTAVPRTVCWYHSPDKLKAR